MRTESSIFWEMHSFCLLATPIKHQIIEKPSSFLRYKNGMKKQPAKVKNFDL